MKELRSIKYYHVTDTVNIPAINQHGLQANKNGEIFVFNNEDCIPYAVLNQLFHKRFAVFQIDHNGITGKIENDNVAELTAKYQFIIYQPSIEPKFLKLMGVNNSEALKNDAQKYLLNEMVKAKKGKRGKELADQIRYERFVKFQEPLMHEAVQSYMKQIGESFEDDGSITITVGRKYVYLKLGSKLLAKYNFHTKELTINKS